MDWQNNVSFGKLTFIGLVRHDVRFAMRRIMYIEFKGTGISGPGRIGWVERTKSGRSFLYRGKRLQKTESGYKYNCIDVETGDHYWVSGPKKRGGDTMYGGLVEIDDDARGEYWLKIRNRPQDAHLTKYRG